MVEQNGTLPPLSVFGWAQDMNGCGNYRIGMPMWGLKGRGHDTVAYYGPDPSINPRTDVVVGQLMYDEHRASQFQEIATWPGRRPVLIFEIDDDVWNIHPSNEPAQVLRNRAVLSRVEESARAADAVTVTTPQLAEVLSQFNEHVYVLPNCIDLDIITRMREPNERLTIGWAGGSSHVNDFADMQSNLRSFLKKQPDVDLHFIGHDFRDAIGLPNVRWSGWSADLRDYLYSIDFDIGIAPLAPNDFNRSKSDIKILEYAALGVPAVATDFGPYAASIKHGETGFLVKHPHEWGTYLRMLVEDAQLRAELSINAKIWASERTIQGNAVRWEQVYRETIQRVHGGPRRTPAAASPTSGSLVDAALGTSGLAAALGTR